MKPNLDLNDRSDSKKRIRRASCDSFRLILKVESFGVIFEQFVANIKSRNKQIHSVPPRCMKNRQIICGEACLKGEGRADVCVSGTKGR